MQNGEKMKGTVEVDEAYIGGQWRFMHYERKQRYETWAQQKEIIVGMKNRETGQITAKVVPDRTRKELQEFIHERIKDGTVVLTDDHSSYRGMPMHKFVNHSGWQFVNGEIHVNGMENFWSILKRGYKGIYHRMSPKHLQRYINEFTGRLNIRDLDTIEKMAMVSMGLFGKRLKRRDLIAGKGAVRASHKDRGARKVGSKQIRAGLEPAIAIFQVAALITWLPNYLTTYPFAPRSDGHAWVNFA